MLRLSPLLLLLLAACSAPHQSPQDTGSAVSESAQSTVPAPATLGSERDSHGCIGSAGYRWCQKSQQCERPWELAKQQGFDNTAEAFEHYCGPDEATPAAG